MSRIAERIQVLEKEGTLFSLFDYAYFEGNSFEVYYLGFSKAAVMAATSNKERKSKCVKK